MTSLCECCGVTDIAYPSKREEGKVYVCPNCYANHYHNDTETQLLILSRPLDENGKRRPIDKRSIAKHLGITVEEVEADEKSAAIKVAKKLRKIGYEP